MVGYFIQKPEVWEDKYLCVCSESPKGENTTEGSTILINKDTFEWDNDFIDKGERYIWCNCNKTIYNIEVNENKKSANFVYLGVHDYWNVCNVKGRAWSYAVVKEKKTESEHKGEVKKYMIINLHGAHPLSDFDKPAYGVDESTRECAELVE